MERFVRSEKFHEPFAAFVMDIVPRGALITIVGRAERANERKRASKREEEAVNRTSFTFFFSKERESPPFEVFSFFCLY